MLPLLVGRILVSWTRSFCSFFFSFFISMLFSCLTVDFHWTKKNKRSEKNLRLQLNGPIQPDSTTHHMTEWSAHLLPADDITFHCCLPHTLSLFALIQSLPLMIACTQCPLHDFHSSFETSLGHQKLYSRIISGVRVARGYSIRFSISHNTWRGRRRRYETQKLRSAQRIPTRNPYKIWCIFSDLWATKMMTIYFHCVGRFFFNGNNEVLWAERFSRLAFTPGYSAAIFFFLLSSVWCWCWWTPADTIQQQYRFGEYYNDGRLTLFVVICLSREFPKPCIVVSCALADKCVLFMLPRIVGNAKQKNWYHNCIIRLRSCFNQTHSSPRWARG